CGRKGAWRRLVPMFKSAILYWMLMQTSNESRINSTTKKKYGRLKRKIFAAIRCCLPPITHASLSPRLKPNPHCPIWWIGRIAGGLLTVVQSTDSQDEASSIFTGRKVLLQTLCRGIICCSRVSPKTGEKLI